MVYASFDSTHFYPNVRSSGSRGRTEPNRTERARKLRLFGLVLLMLACAGLGALVHLLSGDGEVQAAAVTVGGSSEAGGDAVRQQNADREQVVVREQIVVLPGDTLWAIAEPRTGKGEDIRVYIEKLKKVNGLTSSALQAGQVLQLP